MRTKLIDRELPHYTKGEEMFNSISHIVCQRTVFKKAEGEGFQR